MKKTHDRFLWGMAIDLDKCTGCGACSASCQAENNSAFRADESDKLRSATWLKIYRVGNGKKWPDYRDAFVPRPCMHCDHHTPCVSVCPPTATTRDEEGGIVSQIYTRCIGCRYCVAACPYHARYFNWFDQEFPPGTEEYLNPDVSVRMRGVVEKCHFCHHRWMAAKERAANDGEDIHEVRHYTPACVEACPNGAMVFGDLLNKDSEVYHWAHDPRAFRLLERLGTEPKVYYLTSQEWIKRWGDNYLPGEKPGHTKTAAAH